MNEKVNGFVLRDEFSSIGRNYVSVIETDSTNNLAKKYSELPHGTVFVAKRQENGRGRSGKVWYSDNEDGLWMSILLKPEEKIVDYSKITLIAGLSVRRAISKLTTKPIFIKWPNDLVLNNKKLGGILSEISFDEDRIKYIVCGIGINVSNREFNDEILNVATSLYKEGIKNIDSKLLCDEIIKTFQEYYDVFISSGIEELIDEYKSACITIGKDVKVLAGGIEYFARAVDITKNGELVIEVNGKKSVISSGDVSVRGIFGYV